MRDIGRIIFVLAAVVGFATLVRYLAYGVDEQFGWGFAAGAGLMTIIGIIGMHLAEKEAREKAIEELSRPISPLDL